MKLLFIIGPCVIGNFLFAQSPGNVSSSLQLWLKADAGTSTTTDGASLSQWADQSGNSKHAVQSIVMRGIYLLLFFCFFSLLCAGQEQSTPIDSLKRILNSSNNEFELTQVEIELGNEYLKLNFDSSLFYLESAVQHASSIKNDTLLALAYNNMNRVYVFAGIVDKAMEYLLLSVDIYKEHDLKNKLIGSYNNIGTTLYKNENLSKALEYYLLAEQELLNNQELVGEKFPYMMGVILNNIGIVHENMDELDNALEVYFRALNFSKEYGDKVTMANLYSNIGLAYQKLERFELAESNMREAQKIRTEIADQYGLARSYMHLGSLFMISGGSLDSALFYLEKSIELAQKVGGAEIIVHASKALGEVHFKSESFEKAYQFFEQHDHWEDSLRSENANQMIADLELKLKYEEKQSELMLEKQQRDKLYLIIGGSLLVISLLSIFMWLIQRYKSKNIRLQKSQLTLNNRHLTLQKTSLKEQLEFKNKELTTNVMYLMKKNELLKDVSDRLINLKKNLKKENTSPVQKIIMDLNTAKDHDTWEEFELRFQQVYNEFYNQLLQQFPDISSNEKKLCAFLRLDLSSKEICTMTGQSINSLNVARARLRKKLGLNTDDNLTSFLAKY